MGETLLSVGRAVMCPSFLKEGSGLSWKWSSGHLKSVGRSRQTREHPLALKKQGTGRSTMKRPGIKAPCLPPAGKIRESLPFHP